MTIYDSHLHVGLLSDVVVVHPADVKSFVSQFGVTGGLVMPTAHVGGNDNLKLHKVLYHEASKYGFQVALYLNLDIIKMLKDSSYDFTYPFCAFKIHPEAVNYSDRDLDDVCTIIGGMNKPLLIHTGGVQCTRALRFESIVRRYKEQTFILCHARPSEDAFSLLNKYENVWIDTAFLSAGKIKNYVSRHNEDRILFGSDYPINRWYPLLSDDECWYQRQITEIVNNYSVRVSEKILCANYLRLLKKYL